MRWFLLKKLNQRRRLIVIQESKMQLQEKGLKSNYRPMLAFQLILLITKAFQLKEQLFIQGLYFIKNYTVISSHYYLGTGRSFKNIYIRNNSRLLLKRSTQTLKIKKPFKLLIRLFISSLCLFYRHLPIKQILIDI